MAIEQAGSTLQIGVTSSANTGTVSSAITVPADAEIVLVGVSGFQGSAGGFESMTFTKGGVDTAMTKVTGGDASSSTWQGSMFWLNAPDTGANKSLKWDWIGAGTSGDSTLNFSLTFWKGIDAGDPVRDSDGAQASSFPVTTPTLTAETGDLIVAWCSFFESSQDGSGEVSTWTGLTELDEVTHSFYSEGAWATGEPSGNTTVEASTGTAAQPAIMAVVLKPAAAGVTGTMDADEAGSDTASGEGTVSSRRGGGIDLAPVRQRRKFRYLVARQVEELLGYGAEPQETAPPPTPKRVREVRKEIVRRLEEAGGLLAPVRTTVGRMVQAEVKQGYQAGMAWAALAELFQSVADRAAEEAARIEQEIEDEDEMILMLAA